MLLSLAATTVLTLFLTQRVLVIKAWRRLPLVVWLVFAIYADSYVFVIASAVLLHSSGVNTSLRACDSAILICLTCYVTTKIFIYLFVEKAHLMRPTPKDRMRSKLYLFNSFSMLGVYVILVLFNFIFRIAEIKDGTCVIGMQSLAMVPLISFDTVVNVYLTIMFLIPLRKLYSFKHMPRSRANVRLRTIAFKTFCGATCTLLSSIVNLSILMALDGEPGWVCLMCCNSDILFSAIVVQWVTSKDNAGTSSTTSSSRGTTARREAARGPASMRVPTPCALQSITSLPTEHDEAAPPASLTCLPPCTDGDDKDDPGDDVGRRPASPAALSGVVATTAERESTLGSARLPGAPQHRSVGGLDGTAGGAAERPGGFVGMRGPRTLIVTGRRLLEDTGQGRCDDGLAEKGRV